MNRLNDANIYQNSTFSVTLLKYKDGNKRGIEKSVDKISKTEKGIAIS